MSHSDAQVTDTVKSDATPLIACIVCLFLTLLVFGGGMAVGWKNGAEAEQEHFRREAVKQGHAEYDRQTGRWKWKLLLESEMLSDNVADETP